MSHVTIDSVVPADVYNRLLIDHDATERAEHLELKQRHLSALFKILMTHRMADFIELHLLHRHFVLQDGEALIHRTVEIPGTEQLAPISVDIARVINCPESIIPTLVPLLWMASPDGNLVAYEYGLRENADSATKKISKIAPDAWNAFAAEFSTYVHSVGIADTVSLKDRGCINGGEYVVPSMRVLFRVPTEVIQLQPGSSMLESGWEFQAEMGLDDMFPECTDGHVTKTRQTTAGTVAQYHAVEEDGEDAFNPREVPSLYTRALWAAAKSEETWALGREVDVAVQFSSKFLCSGN